MASTVSNALLKRLRESKPDPAWLEMPPEIHRELFEPPEPVSVRTALLAAAGIAVVCFVAAGWISA